MVKNSWLRGWDVIRDLYLQGYALAKTILGLPFSTVPIAGEYAWRVLIYYDAGANVKCNFSVAYTTNMLAWSVLENLKSLGPLPENVRVAIRWETDYVIKRAIGTSCALCGC
ncbi:putative cellulase [Helianthus debilis subsp. tardiflorus]